MAIQYVDTNCDAVSSIAHTYAITAGSNDTLTITVDGGSPQTITLTAGASRTATQIAADINGTLTGATAYAVGAGAQANHVRIRTTSSSGASSTITFGSPAHNAAATLGFSGTYTGFSRIHNTWTQSLGTKQELINQIETQLNLCGWTTISGSGTTNLLLQSALSPPGSDLQYRLRCKDNAGNCVTLTIENVAGTLAQTSSTTVGTYLLPAVAKTWLFTCNKYQGCIRTGNNIAREFAFFSTPALPTFLQGVITECGYLHGNSISDASTTVPYSFANGLYTGLGNNNANQSAFLNGIIVSNSGNPGSNFAGAQGVTVNGNMYASQAALGWQWHDNSVSISDPLIYFTVTSISTTGKLRGYIWDAVTVSGNSFAVGLTTTFDSHNWTVITDASLSSVQQGNLGALLLTTP